MVSKKSPSIEDEIADLDQGGRFSRPRRRSGRDPLSADRSRRELSPSGGQAQRRGEPVRCLDADDKCCLPGQPDELRQGRAPFIKLKPQFPALSITGTSPRLATATILNLLILRVKIFYLIFVGSDFIFASGIRDEKRTNGYAPDLTFSRQGFAPAGNG